MTERALSSLPTTRLPGSRRRVLAHGRAAATRLLLFRIGEERFAAGLTEVERVTRRETPRRIPDVAPWIDGAIAAGDDALPIVDLRVRLGLPATPWGERARTLVVCDGLGAFGVSVDEVLDIAAVDEAVVHPPAAGVRGLPARYLRGLATIEGSVVLVLDLARLVSSEERLALVAASARATDVGRNDG